MIVENNEAMKGFRANLKTFMDETKCCLTSHDNRIREIEIKGSKPAEDALTAVKELDARITPLEDFKTDHEGQLKGLNRTSAVIAGIIALIVTLVGIGVDLYFRFAGGK